MRVTQTTETRESDYLEQIRQLAELYGVVGRRFRERLTAREFELKHLQWSPWTLAFCKTTRPRQISYRPRPSVGKKKDTIYQGDFRCPAVYEISVQARPYQRLHAVYSVVTSGFSHKLWERSLLGKRIVQDQLDSVLSYGCRVYIRRALLSDAGTLQQTRDAMERLDYAWSDCRGTGKHRRLFDGRIPLSLEFQQRKT